MVPDCALPAQRREGDGKRGIRGARGAGIWEHGHRATPKDGGHVFVGEADGFMLWCAAVVLRVMKPSN